MLKSPHRANPISGKLGAGLPARFSFTTHDQQVKLNGDALKELVEKHGVKVRKFPEDILDQLRKK